MTKKQLLQYYLDFKERVTPHINSGDAGSKDTAAFLAGMKHILVIQGIIKGNND